MSTYQPIPNKNSKIQFTAELIGPEGAAYYLSLNIDKNRNPRKAMVSLYARDMSFDQWPETSEAVAIDENGRLVDGQHRLLAIIKSEKTVPVTVARGQPEAAYSKLDQGLKRSYADATGLAPTIVQAVSSLMEETGLKQKSVATVEAFSRAWDESMHVFIDSGVSLKTRGVSIAPVRAACIARIGIEEAENLTRKDGQSDTASKFAIEQYRSLTEFSSENPLRLAPLTAGLHKRLTEDTHTGATKRSAIFWLAFHAFGVDSKQDALRASKARNKRYLRTLTAAHEALDYKATTGTEEFE